MAYLLGIDVGTSGTKALICDEGGSILASETVEHPSYHPKPLWSEQQPQDWWQTTVASVRKAVAQAGISGKEISAIGLSGQMHGAVFLDKHNEVLRPAILWNDQRTAEECDEITVREKSRQNPILLETMQSIRPDSLPPYLSRDDDAFSGKLTARPDAKEIPIPVVIDYNLIVEFYSQ